jgi:hypothetical protein
MPPSKSGRVVKIPRKTEFGRIIERELCNSHILENLVFPAGQDESEYDITKRFVEVMEQAELEKGKIYAFIKTGRILSDVNVKYVSSEEKEEWIEAIEKYESLVASGVLQPSDSLVPFIQASRKVPNPRKSKAELEHLFDNRNLHRTVVQASRSQFINYDFPNAVLSAYRKLLVSAKKKVEILKMMELV